MKRHEVGSIGEGMALTWLRRSGVKAELTRPCSPFDIEASGVRFEVKTSRLDSRFRFHFNIHRHGVLNESCDYYVLVFLGLRRPCYLVKSPIGRKTITLTIGQLVHPYYSRNLYRRVPTEVTA